MNKRNLTILIALLLMGMAAIAQADEKPAQMPWYWFSDNSGTWGGSYLFEHNGGEGSWNHDVYLVRWGKVRLFDARSDFAKERNIYKTQTVRLLEEQNWSGWQVKRLYAYYVASVLNAADGRGGRVPKWAMRHALTELNKELRGEPVNMNRVERSRKILRRYCGFKKNSNKAMATEEISIDELKSMYR